MNMPNAPHTLMWLVGRCLKSPPELRDPLVKGPMTPSEIQDLILSFQRAVIERTMAAEINLHLGYRPGEDKPEGHGPTSAIAFGLFPLTSLKVHQLRYKIFALETL